MVPPPSQDSFTFTVGKLGQVSSWCGPGLSLILSALDAGMAVGPGIVEEHVKLSPAL